MKSPSDYVPEDGCRFIVHFAKARVRTSDLTMIEDREFKLVSDDFFFQNAREHKRIEKLT